MKCKRLSIDVVVIKKFAATTTSMQLPEELFSVEEALKMLAGALKCACS